MFRSRTSSDKARRPNFWLAAALAALCLGVHYSLISIGLFQHDTDLMNAPLLAEDFLKGRFSAFYYQQEYGGTLLTFFRALWLGIASVFTSSHVGQMKANFAFSYLALPVAMMGLAYFATRAYCSRRSAALVALLCAFGFQFWVHQGGNEFYFAAIFLGFVFLGWKGTWNNPFWDLPFLSLFWISVVCGLSLYTFRATIIYILPFFLSWPWAKKNFDRLLSPRDLGDRWILYLSSVFTFLWLYLAWFGSYLGVWHGREVKLHSTSNLKFLLVLALITLWKWNRKLIISREFFSRLACLSGGLVLGLLPEIVTRLAPNALVRTNIYQSYTFEEGLIILGRKFPRAISELMGGYQHFNAYKGLLHNFPVLLGFAGLCSLFFFGMRRNSRLVPVCWSALLALVAYLTLETYDLGPSRYLAPIFPAMVIGIGVLLDELERRGLIAVGALLIFASGTYQLVQRNQSIHAIRSSGKVLLIEETARAFTQAPVRVVITDDFWKSNQYSMFTNRNPYFVSTERAWGPLEGFALSRTEREVGILLTGRERDPQVIKVYLDPKTATTLRNFHGSDWRVHYLRTVGAHQLLLGIRQ